MNVSLLKRMVSDGEEKERVGLAIRVMYSSINLHQHIEINQVLCIFTLCKSVMCKYYILKVT